MTNDSAIRLDDFLKTSGLTATGGQAKILIQSGQVLVNGQIETRRRKQLQIGDVVAALGESFQVTGTNQIPSETDDEVE